MAYELIAAGVPYWAAFFLTLVFSFIVGVAIERLIMRRVKDAPALTAVIVFIGLLLSFNGLAGWLFHFGTSPAATVGTSWHLWRCLYDTAGRDRQRHRRRDRRLAELSRLSPPPTATARAPRGRPPAAARRGHAGRWSRLPPLSTSRPELLQLLGDVARR